MPPSLRRLLPLLLGMSWGLLGQNGTQTRVLRLPGGLHAGDVVTIRADTITAVLKPGHRMYRADGHVQIEVRDLSFSADHLTYDETSGEAVASGHVAFDSEREQTHIEGASGRYNFLTSTGEFHDFQGVSGIRLRGRGAAALARNPLIFSGSVLERLGPRRYRLEHGTVTSCSLPRPKWTLSAASVEIELGGEARLRHAVFRLWRVPVFYAPFLTHSTTRLGRHSGVLVPVVSHSNVKGYVLGDSFFWAAGRNVNLTAGGEFYTSRGFADHLTFDSMPTRNSVLGVQLDGVFDRGVPQPGGVRLRQGGQELHLTGNHEAENGWRSVLDVDYLSSYLYRLVFKNTFADAINSEAISTGFTERQRDGRDLAIVAHRYQDFLGNSPHASLSLAELPSLDWNAYAQPLGRRLPVYFSWDNNFGLLDRSEPSFATGAMERFDLEPRLTMPLDSPVGNFTGDVSARTTFYSARQEVAPSFAASTAPQLLPGNLWRNSASADLEWDPPALERVYNTPSGWFGDRLKHVFEPLVAYHYTGGISDPNQIIRFDDRDILSNTSEVEYGFTNRLLSGGATAGHSRELMSWTLVQKYFFDPTFGGALTPGQRNIFLTTELLSPFDIEALPLRFSPLSSVVRVSPFTLFDGEWRLDYNSHDHQIAASAFSGNFHFGQGFFFSGSHYLLRPPPALSAAQAPPFNQMRFSTGFGNAQAPGISLAGGVAYDVRSGRLQYTSLQATRNWDCCGFSFEYRRFSLASVRRENQFLISFTLANVASFGNLKRQQSLF